MVRDAPLGFRVQAEVKAALERAAADDSRSVSSLVELVMKAWLTERGYLEAPTPSMAAQPAAVPRTKASSTGLNPVKTSPTGPAQTERNIRGAQSTGAAAKSGALKNEERKSATSEAESPNPGTGEVRWSGLKNR